MQPIQRRRQQLKDERETLEQARLAIASGLPIPSIAQQYVTAQSGQNGERMHGDELRNWLDLRLTEIQKQLAALPFIATRRIATAMSVIGKDYTQTKPAPGQYQTGAPYNSVDTV